MAITIGGWSFEGPLSSTDLLEDRSGVYAILDSSGANHGLLDCGESAQVRSRVEAHDRADCWRRNASGSIKYAVHYTPHLQAPGRREIEKAIRDQYDPPCGKI